MSTGHTDSLTTDIDFPRLIEWANLFSCNPVNADDKILLNLNSLLKVRIRSLSEQDVRNAERLVDIGCSRASLASSWLQYSAEAATLFAGLDNLLEQGLDLGEDKSESTLQSLLKVVRSPYLLLPIHSAFRSRYAL